MQYFARVPKSVFKELENKGVNTDKLKFSAKADLDEKNCYYDIYLFVDDEKLHIISGIEKIVKKENKISNRRNRYFYFESSEYKNYDLKDIESFKIYRQINTAKFIVNFKNGEKATLCLFSIGYADMFQNFSDCIISIKNNEKINLDKYENLQYYCPKCGYRYPERERKVCPNCTDKMSIFKRLFNMYLVYKGYAILILILLIFSSIIAIVSPLITEKMLYDDVLTLGGKFYGQILFIVILIVILGLVNILTTMAFNVLTVKITPKVTHDLRMNIFSSLQNLSIGFFTSKQTGTLMSRILNDSENIYWFFIDVIPYTIINFIKILGLVSIMLWLQPILTLIIIVAIIISQIWLYNFNKKRRKLHRKRYKSVRAAYSIVSDTINGQRVVKAFAKENKEIERYEYYNTQLR
ncbi:MAG: ABC transporter transmembrane domain-containing protein, partial [Oscillospiraceae bacterium]